MKRIIIIAKPFATYQKVLVYENGTKIDGMETTYQNLAQTVFHFINEYKITRVDLTGPKHYTKGLANQFTEFELKKYNQNLITFNII